LLLNIKTRAATSGDIRQETEYATFVTQRAILFNLMPDCVKGAASKLAAKIAITKKTTNITQVNTYTEQQNECSQ
jgi:hypothetical protein